MDEQIDQLTKERNGLYNKIQEADAELERLRAYEKSLTKQIVKLNTIRIQAALSKLEPSNTCIKK
jgi:uncharacterized coiled-coil DUF342 family protein